jgi:hypothetical protein
MAVVVVVHPGVAVAAPLMGEAERNPKRVKYVRNRDDSRGGK